MSLFKDDIREETSLEHTRNPCGVRMDLIQLVNFGLFS